MARQVVSYDDLDTPLVAPILNSPDTSAPATATSSSADTTGRGTIGTVDNTNTAYLTSEGVDAISAAGQNRFIDNKTISSVESSPPKKRKRDDTQHQSQPTAGNTSSGIRKRKNRGRQGNKNLVNGMGSGNGTAGIPSLSVQHWDDPGAEVDGLAYDDGEATAVKSTKDTANDGHEGYGNEESAEVEDWVEKGEGMDEDENEEDESRELTHDEIWDDSALVAAWDAANEEYEALHGKNKQWKKGRVHKSPLWYNIPPEPQDKSKGKQKAKTAPEVDNSQGPSTHQRPMKRGAGYGDSTPLDFNTYVPTHDASLSSAVGATQPPSDAVGDYPSNITAHYATSSFGFGALPNATSYPPGRADSQTSLQANIGELHQMSADVAFSRALDAMYWCGYWTAMYHTQRSKEHGAEGADDAHGDEEDEEEETELLVTTQR